MSSTATPLDYTSHPGDLVTPGVSLPFSLVNLDAHTHAEQEVNSTIKIQDLRDAIPARCFKPSYLLSLWYLFRDLMLAATVMTAAFIYIPHIKIPLARCIAWAMYGYFEGLIMTGIWVCQSASRTELIKQY